MLKITQIFTSFVPNELLLTGGLTKFVWPRAAGGPSARNNEILRKLFETNHRNSLNYLRTTYGIRNKATLPPLSINLAYQDFIQELAEGLSYPTPYLLSARLSTALSYQQLKSDRPEEDLETVLKTMAMSSEASMRIKGKTIETQPMVERLMETYRKFNEQTIAPPTTIEFLQRLHDQLLDASVIDSAKSKKVMEEMSKLEQEVIDINLQEPVIASVLGDENFSDPKSLSDRPELQFETHGFDTNWSNPRTNPNQSELELLKSYVEALTGSKRVST